MRLIVVEPEGLSPVVIDADRRIWEPYPRPFDWKGQRRWRRTCWLLLENNRTRSFARASVAADTEDTDA